MKLTEQQLEQVKKIYADPDFALVKGVFMEYLEDLIDIRKIDSSDTAVSVKGEIKAKIKFYELALRFFSDVNTLIELAGRNETNYE